jgi:hypothetical protein
MASWAAYRSWTANVEGADVDESDGSNYVLANGGGVDYEPPAVLGIFQGAHHRNLPKSPFGIFQRVHNERVLSGFSVEERLSCG